MRKLLRLVEVFQEVVEGAIMAEGGGNIHQLAEKILIV